MTLQDNALHKIWCENFIVHSYEVASNKLATVPTLCQYMQEVAWHHAENLRVGFSDLLNQNLVWVLYAQMIRIDDYPVWGDTIQVRTWPSGKERLFYERNFNILSNSGKHLAAATSRWLVIDMTTRRPQRIDFKFRSEMVFPEHALECKFVKLDIAGDMEIQTFTVDYFDLDVNSHVNNVRYIEWILRSYDPDFHHSHRLLELEIHYMAEALYGEEIAVSRQQQDHLNFYHLLRSLPSGKELCRVRTRWLEM